MYFTQKPKIFISHQRRDLEFAIKLKNQLEIYGIDTFVAKYDDNGNDWRTTIPDEIENREYFVVLLSDNYHKGDYTDHEYGMAFMKKKEIRILNINDCETYGFIEKYHHRHLSEINTTGDYSFHDVVKLLFGNDRKIIMPYLLEKFCNSGSFENTRYLNSELKKMNFIFDNNDLNKIAQGYIDNHDIHECSGIPYMINVLKNSFDKINPKLVSAIKNGFNCNWCNQRTMKPFYDNYNLTESQSILMKEEYEQLKNININSKLI